MTSPPASRMEQAWMIAWGFETLSICMQILYQDKICVMWSRIGFFLIILFLILLSDGVLADWVPGYLQNALGSPLKMGLMMAVSSLVGVSVDLIFPQLLRRVGVRRIASGAMLGSLLFLFTLLSHTWREYVVILVVGMAVWGIYYELDSFMTQQFVAGVAPRDQRSSVWGVIGMVRSLAYFLGPLIGAWLIQWGDRVVVISAMGILVLGYVAFMLIKLPQSEGEELEWEEISILDELKHWMVLGRRVWPILLASLMGGIIDATFWTTGVVLNDRLAEVHYSGGWLVSAYMLPFLFVGLIVAKWGVDEGKKRWAQTFLLLAGLCLVSFWWITSIPLMILAAICVGASLSAAWPLIDSVYTDLVARARRGKKHIMGMSAAMYGGAYVIGPIIAGFLNESVGDSQSFAVVGAGVVVISIMLLLTTPKKLALPQTEINKWDQ